MRRLTSKHGMSSIADHNESVLVPRRDRFSGHQFPISDVFGLSGLLVRYRSIRIHWTGNSLDHRLQNRAKIFLGIIPQDAWFYRRSKIYIQSLSTHVSVVQFGVSIPSVACELSNACDK